MTTNSISRKVGFPPGTLLYVGDERNHQIYVSIWSYNHTQFLSFESTKLSDVYDFMNEKPDFTHLIWIDGVYNPEIIREAGDIFKINDLSLEDIMNTNQRTKIDDFNNYVLLICKTIEYKSNFEDIDTEQISLILGSNYVIIFTEQDSDRLNTLLRRLPETEVRTRHHKADYLFYSIMDLIVDNYLITLENIGFDIENMEDQLMNQQIEIQNLYKLQLFKKMVNQIYKIALPLRDCISKLDNKDRALFNPNTLEYISDLKDHILIVGEMVDNYQFMLAELTNLYLSLQSNKMNEIMKVLTIITTIFIPLTFIAGIYGMNFINMPELKWEYGYFAVLFIMLIIALYLFAYFKHKKWF